MGHQTNANGDVRPMSSDQCRQVKEQPGNMHKSHVK